MSPLQQHLLRVVSLHKHNRFVVPGLRPFRNLIWDKTR